MLWEERAQVAAERRLLGRSLARSGRVLERGQNAIGEIRLEGLVGLEAGEHEHQGLEFVGLRFARRSLAEHQRLAVRGGPDDEHEAIGRQASGQASVRDGLDLLRAGQVAAVAGSHQPLPGRRLAPQLDRASDAGARQRLDELAVATGRVGLVEQALESERELIAGQGRGHGPCVPYRLDRPRGLTRSGDPRSGCAARGQQLPTGTRLGGAPGRLAVDSVAMQIPGLEIRVDTRAIPWRATRSPGVEWYVLHSEEPESTSGRRKASDSTVLIRMAPGCGYPVHRHLDVEEVLVLAGGYRDELGTYRTGDYVRYPAGSRHAPIALGDPDREVGSDNPACVLYATARGGIELA